jgi:N-acetylmuramoyl-L-alanine amidase
MGRNPDEVARYRMAALWEAGRLRPECRTADNLVSEFRLGLDPGHGGKHRGGWVRHGDLYIEEREWCWHMAALIHRAVLCCSWGVRSRILREGVGETVTLAGRGKRSEGCDAVICLHLDTNPSINGARVYVLPDDVVAWDIGSQILRALPSPFWGSRLPIVANRTEEEGRRWLQRPLAVLGPHRGRSPVLVECAAISNADEAHAAASVKGLAGLTAAVMAGVAVAL